MGWSEGSEIAEELWEKLKSFIPSNERSLASVSKIIYETFESRDADDWSYLFYEDNSIYETYLRLNEPEEYKELRKALK